MTTLATKEFAEDYVNPRGIPRVQFVENVEQYVKAKGLTIETILKQLQEQHSKYKLMEHKLSQNKTHLANKIPEITKTVDTLTFLRKKLDEEDTGFTTNYGLTDSVFCEATVTPQKTVHLWLGASVMVEYTFDEALTLLKKNLSAAKQNLESTQEDLAWLSDQQVVLEVNTARVYNHDVVSRRDEAKN